jgi:hypothetical protein
MAKPWSLSDAERADTAARIASNLATLSFFKGREVRGDWGWRLRCMAHLQ